MSDQAVIPAADPYASKPATFEQQEAARESAEKVRHVKGFDDVDEVIGSRIKFINYSGPWFPAGRPRFSVLRFYTTAAAVFDMPKSQEEAETKQAVLNPLGIAYLYILPGQVKQQSQLIKELQAQRTGKPVANEPDPKETAAQLEADRLAKAAARDQVKQTKVKAQSKAAKKDKVKKDSKLKRLAKTAAMLFLVLGSCLSLQAATPPSYLTGAPNYGLQRVAPSKEKLMGSYACDINGNTLMSFVDSTANVASAVLSGTASTLYALSGYNAGGAQFLQVFNTTTVPADTAVPVITMAIAATSNFVVPLPQPWGRFFSTGICVSNSSTQATKTIGSANLWINAVLK